MCSNNNFPAGCPHISAEQPVEELIVNLKNLLLKLREEGQEGFGDEFRVQEKKYILLFHNLIGPEFISHESHLIKMAVACCLGELLRFLPLTSFKWSDKELVVPLEFFIKQLEYFGTSDGVVLRFCVILLKVLSKSEILSRLFMLLQYTTNKENIYDTFLLVMCTAIRAKKQISAGEEIHIVQLMETFINNTKFASYNGLDIILYSILYENADNHPAMYRVAVKIIRDCRKALYHPVKMLLYRGLQLVDSPTKTRISGHVHEVMVELQHICPDLLLGVWNQLERFMLKFEDTPKKKDALKVLTYMFTEKHSNFAAKYSRLWSCFKICVDKTWSPYGRSLIVHYAPRFLINRPDYRGDIINILKNRACDKEPEIRFGVVKAINRATKRDLYIINNDDLVDILKTGLCDENIIVLKEAIITLGLIYRRITDNSLPGLMTRAYVIANQLMHLYRAPHDINIRMPYIEEALHECLVPYDLPPEERMKKLLQFWCLLDDDSRMNFHHYLELKKSARAITSKLLSLYQEPSDDTDGPTHLQGAWLRKFWAGKLSLTMGNQRDARKRLLVLLNELEKNKSLLNFLQEYTKENSCEDYEVLWTENQDLFAVSRRKRRLPVRKPRYIGSEKINLAVKSLCGKVALLVDEVAMKELLKLVTKYVTGSDIPGDLELMQDSPGNPGIDLIYEYFYLMPHLAFQEDAMDQLMSFLASDNHLYRIPALRVFTTLSAYKPLVEVFPVFVSGLLVPLWLRFARKGTPEEAKLAVRCLCSHTTEDNEPVIADILRGYLKELDADSEHYLMREVAVGHFAKHLPNYSNPRCIADVTEICDKLVQKLILEVQEDESSDDAEWYEKDCLPYETKCKVEALKALTRLTVRLCDPAATERTLTILDKIVENESECTHTDNLSTATKAWLRLTAGCSFLKICDVRVIFGAQVRRIYFFKMATLMIDKSVHVRRMFVEKLCEKLMQWDQQKFGLPSIFISYFALAGLEQDKKIKSSMSDALNECVLDKRVHVWNYVFVSRYFVSVPHFLETHQHIVPEYCVQAALQLVARYLFDFDFTDDASIGQAHSCLSFLLNSLLGTKSGRFGKLARGYYIKIFRALKSWRNAINPEDDELNKKIWAMCEISESILTKMPAKVDEYTEAPCLSLDPKFHQPDPKTAVSQQNTPTSVPSSSARAPPSRTQHPSLLEPLVVQSEEPQVRPYKRMRLEASAPPPPSSMSA